MPSLLREKNEERLEASEEVTNKKGTDDEKEARQKYAEIYIQLTKLAYVDLLKFVQGLNKERIKKMYEDKDILKYIQDAIDFLTDVDEKMIENYIDACVMAIGQTEKGKEWEKKWGGMTWYAFAPMEKQRAAQSDILLDDVLYYMEDSELKKAIALANGTAQKTSDLRDSFGLKLARQYSNYVTTKGDSMDAKPELKKKREIARAAYVIEASSDKYWYRPLFREDTDTETDKFWYAQGMEYSTLTEDHLKTLCTFPRAYSFADATLTDIRKAVGDSVPPLITMRLGLTMQYVDETSQTVSDEVALHSLLNFTPEDLSEDPLEELIDDFEEWLSKKKRKRKRKGQKKKLSKNSVEMYMKEIRKHFKKDDTEFLGKGMFDTEALGYGDASRQKTSKKKGGGTPRHAAFRYWIEFLEQKFENKFKDDWFTRYANTKSLEWRKGLRRKTSQFHKDHLNRTLLKEEKKQLQNLKKMLSKGNDSLTKKEFEKKQKRYNETIDVLVQAFKVRSDILSRALAAIKKSAPSNQPKKASVGIDQLMDKAGSDSPVLEGSSSTLSDSTEPPSSDSSNRSRSSSESGISTLGDRRKSPSIPPTVLSGDEEETRSGDDEPAPPKRPRSKLARQKRPEMLLAELWEKGGAEPLTNLTEKRVTSMDFIAAMLNKDITSMDSEDVRGASEQIPFSFSHYAVTPRQIMEAMKIDADSVQLKGISGDREKKVRLVMDELIYKQLERKGKLDTVNEVLVNKSLKYEQLTLQFSKTKKAVGRAEGMEYIFGRPSGKVTQDDVPNKVTQDDVPMCVPTANASKREYTIGLPPKVREAWKSFQNINKTLNKDMDWKNFLPYFDNFLGRHWLRVVERHLMKVSKSNYGENKDLDYVSVYSLNMKDELLRVHPLFLKV